jgi:Protein of unknown function (DUF2842)
MNKPDQPTFRKPLGMFAILLLIFVWAVLIASASNYITGWPTLLQGIFYLIAGVVWIFPLRPLLQWMETGRFRPPPKPTD